MKNLEKKNLKESSISHQQCVPKLLECLAKDGPSIEWGTLQSVLTGENCPVCRLLSHLVKQYQASEHPVTHSSDGTELQCSLMLRNGPLLTRLDEPELRDIDVKMWLMADSSSPQTLGQGLSSEMGCFGHQYTFQFDRKEKIFPQPVDHSLRFVRKHEHDDGTVNFEFLASWIQSFQQHHLVECDVHKSTLHSHIGTRFKLIDVVAMSIVDGRTDSRYVALSYVWGGHGLWLRSNKENISALRKLNGLLSVMHQIPATIRDAIVLTRGLGMQYLWIDSLCIIQDDTADKLAQLQCMGAIFEMAELVIVAGSGSDADAGLPGVGLRQYPLRTFRRREFIDTKVRLLSVEPYLPHVLKRIPWSTRGWTYQEAQLARLTLYFTKTQAFLECRCHRSSAESSALDVFHFHSEASSISKQNFNSSVTRGFFEDHDCIWSEWHRLLFEYTTRELSYQQDVLDAVAAILSRLEKKWDTTFNFGLPKVVFGPALLWRHTNLERSYRRECTTLVQHGQSLKQCPIPSWSWAGWTGTVMLERDIHRRGGPCSYEPGEIDPIWEFSDAGVPLSSEDTLRPTLIQATAWTALFDIGQIDREAVTMGPRGNAGDKHPIRKRGHRQILGYIDITGSQYWQRDDPAQSNCELIAIMAQPKTHFQRGPHFKNYWNPASFDRGISDTAPRVVDVLLIKRREDGIAFRVGIGGLLWDDWWAAKPAQKRVILA